MGIKWGNKHIDTAAVPLEWDDAKGSIGAGVFLLIFSLLWGGMPTALLIGSIVQGNFKPDILFTLIFTVIGSGIFLGGLYMLTHKRIISMSDNRVQILDKSIFGRKHFDEHLNNYKGIKNYSEYHSGGKNQSSYTLYINEMIHGSNKKLNVKLDVQRNSSSGMRKLWEDHCRRLNLPALSGETGQEEVRRVEDLDKNVKTLIKEGKIEPEFDPSDAPPAGFTLSVEDGKLKVVMKDTPMMYIVMFFVLAFACWGVYFVLFQDGFSAGSMFPLLIISVFIIIPVWAIIYHALTRPCIVLTDVEIIKCRIKHSGEVATKQPQSIKYSVVESVYVGKSENNNTSLGVVVKSDDKTLHLAAGQKREKLVWLKNCILSSIASW